MKGRTEYYKCPMCDAGYVRCFAESLPPRVPHCQKCNVETRLESVEEEPITLNEALVDLFVRPRLN